MQKIIGIGNALVDIMTTLESDELLTRLELPKGSMQLVDLEYSQKVLQASKHLPSSLAAGGSASNTIYGLAKLGVETAFIGKIGSDEYGESFRQSLETCNITPKLMGSNIHTGRAVALVSQDSERTFATHLGAAVELSADDLKPEHFNGYDIMHIEGYLVQDYKLISRAIDIASDQGLKVSLDMASYNVVEDHLGFMKDILNEKVNIVFANEEEAKSFTGKEPRQALEIISRDCEIAIVKVGKNGSMIMKDNEFHEVGIVDANSIDTTGAGDLYASGFLYGLSKGYSLDKCGEIGALLAGNIIEVLGARMEDDRWENIKTIIENILKK